MSISWSCEIGVSRHISEGSLQTGINDYKSLVYTSTIVVAGHKINLRCEIWISGSWNGSRWQTVSYNIHIPWGKKYRRLNKVMQKEGTIDHHCRDISCIVWWYRHLWVPEPAQQKTCQLNLMKGLKQMMIPHRRWCPPGMWALVLQSPWTTSINCTLLGITMYTMWNEKRIDVNKHNMICWYTNYNMYNELQWKQKIYKNIQYIWITIVFTMRYKDMLKYGMIKEHAPIYIYMYIYIHMWLHMYACVWLYIYIYVSIYVYIYIHMYIWDSGCYIHLNIYTSQFTQIWPMIVSVPRSAQEFAPSVITMNWRETIPKWFMALFMAVFHHVFPYMGL